MVKVDNPAAVGERLRKIRDIRPKTKVAKAIGVSYSALCKYEAGLRTPTGIIKKRIADYYGVKVEDLFF